eukprot:gene23773-9332_t
MPLDVRFAAAVGHAVHKHKLDHKATAFTVSARGFGASGSQSLFVGTEAGYVLSYHPTSGAVRMICNLVPYEPQLSCFVVQWGKWNNSPQLSATIC